MPLFEKACLKYLRTIKSFNLPVSISALSVDNALLDMRGKYKSNFFGNAKEDRGFGGSTHQDVVTIGRQIHQISIWCG